MKVDVTPLEVKEDTRGFLFEILRNQDLGDEPFGHLIITVAHKGQSKGGHYHKTKHEWFCVVKGEATISIIDNSSGEKREIAMGDSNRVLVKIYPNHSHTITNVGNEDVYILTYTDKPFNNNDPDTYRL